MVTCADSRSGYNTGEGEQMMRLIRRPRSPYWHLDVRVDGRRYIRSTGCRKKREAREVAARMIRELAISAAGAGTGNGNGISVRELVEWYLKHAKEEKWVKAYTLKTSIKPRLVALAREFGDRKVEGIRSEEVVGWILGLPVKAATKRAYYRVIRAFWERARKLGKVSKNPLDGECLGMLPRAAKPCVRVLSEDEERRLMEAAAGHRLEVLLMLGLYAGLRIREILNADWEDVDWGRGVLRVVSKPERDFTPKNRQEREVPLARRLREYLWAIREEEGAIAKNGLGKRYSDPPTQSLRRLCRKAGVRPIGWHVLRHTFATRLLEKGATLYQVSVLLGHSSVRVTEDAYGHVAARDLAGVVDLCVGGAAEWESWDDGNVF